MTMENDSRRQFLSTNMGKRKLQRELQVLIKKGEQSIKQSLNKDERRSACIGILEAIESFFGSWTKLKDDTLELPRNFLRQTLSKIVRILGPGDSTLRKFLWGILQSEVSTECSQIILEFLPATILPRSDQDEKTELLEILSNLFDTDIPSVPPILDCLTSICRAGGLSQRDIFKFAIQKLPSEHESRIHFVIKSLLESTQNEMNAKTVIEAMRIEMRCIEETTNSEEAYRYITPTSEILVDFWKKGKSEIFFDTYISVLEGILNLKTGTFVESDQIEETDKQLLVVDLFVVLLSLENPNSRERCHRILDAAILSSYLKVDVMTLFLSSEIWESMPKELVNRMVSLSITFLLFPARCRGCTDGDIEMALESIRDFIMGVFSTFDNDSCSQLISSMLHLTDGVVVNNGQLLRSRPESVSGSDGFQIVSREVFKILRAVSKQRIQILAPFKQMLLNKLTETQSMQRHCDVGLENLCALICNLDVADLGAGNKSLVSDAFLTLRTLLFTPAPCFPSSTEYDTSRCLHGLVLAAQMISFSQGQHGSIKHIWKLIKSILLPPSKQMIHPKIGLYGLRIVQNLFDKGDSELEKDIFQTISHVLSNTRLVQYVSAYGERERKHVAHAYSKQDEFFKSQVDQQKSRKMIFCFDAFIRDPLFMKPSSWEGFSRWVFELVNTYLAIGRKTDQSSRKWSPRPWVEAAIEFQVVDFSRFKIVNAQQKKFLDFMCREMNSNNVICPNGILSDGKARELFEVIKTLKSNPVLDEVIKSLHCLSVSLIATLAMSAAILNNTFEQYQEVLHDQDDKTSFKERTEASRLIHYQLAKIYNLRERCQLIERALQLLNRNSKKKPGRRSKKEKGKSRNRFECRPEITSALAQIKAVTASYCNTSEFVQSNVLWHVVAESSYDATLVDVVQREMNNFALPPATTNDFNLRHITSMKLSALEHLSSHILHVTEVKRKSLLAGVRDTETEYQTILRPKIARCLRFCSYLSLHLLEVQDKQEVSTLSMNITMSTFESLSTLIAAYFRLLSNVLILVVGEPSNRNDRSFKTLVDVTNLFSSILISKQPLEEAIFFDKNTEVSSATCFLSLKKSISSHLEVCNNASIANELIETLTIFSIHFGSEATAEMIKKSWTYLNSKYSKLEVVGSLRPPYSFAIATEKFTSSFKDPSSEAYEFDRSLNDAIMKLNSLKSKSGKTLFVSHGMLRHWGLLALESTNSHSYDDYFYKLLSNIQTFLAEAQVQEPPSNAFCISNDDESSDGDGEYFPPVERRKDLKLTLPDSQIPGLQSTTFSVYFEMLLQMTVAAASIFSVKRESLRNDDGGHPFDRFEHLLDIFGSLIKVYEEKVQIFPQRTMSTVVHASKTMLNVSSFQLTKCIEWRNVQPVVYIHDIDAGTYDAASIEYLKELFDLVGRHVLGRLETFCTAINAFKHTKHTAEYKQRIKSLENKTLRFKGILQKMCSAHNIAQSSLGPKSGTSGDDKPLRKRRRTNASEKPSKDGEKEDQVDLEALPMEEEDKDTLSSEASFGESASTGSSDFEASGRWGDSEDDEESQPELRLQQL